MNIRRIGALAPSVVLVAAGIFVLGCETSIEERRSDVTAARQEAREARKDAAEKLVSAHEEAERRISKADAALAERERELRVADGYDLFSDRFSDRSLADRIARVDERMLDLQGNINRLDAQNGNDAGQTTWQAFDQRRAALKRDAAALDSVPAAELDVRKRMLEEEIQRLEDDLESTIDDLGSQLSRG